MSIGMTKLQIIVVSSMILLFAGMYFGLDNKPKTQKVIEKSRAIEAESTDINALLDDAKSELSTEKSTLILSIETKLNEAQTDSAKVEILKELSGSWYEMERIDIAGFYAESIAEIENDEEAWSIAGTTYAIGVQRAREEKIKQFCFGRAVKAFENAISINPSNTTNKVNLAVCYAENPLPENPMKGILMLRDLIEKEPENVLVLTTLGRFAIQTGQFDKAIERLQKAITIEPENNKANCLLAQAFRGKGDDKKAAEYAKLCK
jgi:tetratricopeptide (TPR) repeat protein